MLSVFNPINQMASMLSVVVAGWLASTVLQNFWGSLGGLRFGPIDTIFAVAGPSTERPFAAPGGAVTDYPRGSGGRAGRAAAQRHGFHGAARKVRAPQGRVVGNADPG